MVNSTSRIHRAVFSPIGDEGRATLVEHRITQAIAAGILEDGQKLPSELQLAEAMGVSLVTAREALSALRVRGLVETRRGRHGGSFVTFTRTEGADRGFSQLASMSRIAINDLGTHYQAVAGMCAELAATRATITELTELNTSLEEAKAFDEVQWRRKVTDIQLELAALSQSARLTREHVKLQAEFAPLITLQDSDPQRRELHHRYFASQIECMVHQDGPGARSIVQASVQDTVRWLLTARSGAGSSSAV